MQSKPLPYIHKVEIPPPGFAIRAGSDAIAAIIEQERGLIEARANAHICGVMEECRRNTHARLEKEAMKRMDAERRITELEDQYRALYKAKIADEGLINNLLARVRDLENQCDTGSFEVLKPTTSSTDQNIAQDAQKNSATEMRANLTTYNIFHWHKDSLCFGGRWLELWNEIGAGTDRPLTSSDYFTPVDLETLLQNSLNQVRNNKHIIEVQHQSIQAMGGEKAYIYQVQETDPMETNPNGDAAYGTTGDHGE